MGTGTIIFVGGASVVSSQRLFPDGTSPLYPDRAPFMAEKAKMAGAQSKTRDKIGRGSKNGPSKWR